MIEANANVKASDEEVDGEIWPVSYRFVQSILLDLWLITRISFFQIWEWIGVSKLDSEPREAKQILYPSAY